MMRFITKKAMWILACFLVLYGPGSAFPNTIYPTYRANAQRTNALSTPLPDKQPRLQFEVNLCRRKILSMFPYRNTLVLVTAEGSLILIRQDDGSLFRLLPLRYINGTKVFPFIDLWVYRKYDPFSKHVLVQGYDPGTTTIHWTLTLDPSEWKSTDDVQLLGITDNKVILFNTRTGRTAVYDLKKGTFLYRIPWAKNPHFAPVLVDEELIALLPDKTLAVWSLEKEDMLWNIHIEEPPVSGLTPAGREVCYVSSSQTFICVNLKTQHFRSSSFPSPKSEFVLRTDKHIVLYEKGKLYFVTFQGNLQWTVPFQGSRPVLVDNKEDRVIVVDSNGVLWTGTVTSLQARTTYASPPVQVLIQGAYFFALFPSSVEKRELDSSRREWVYARKCQPRTLPVADTRVLYIADSEGKLHAISRTDGRVLWARYFRDVSTNTPVLSGNRLFLQTRGYALVEIDPETGQSQWSTHSLSAMQFAPLIFKGILFFDRPGQLIGTRIDDKKDVFILGTPGGQDVRTWISYGPPAAYDDRIVLWTNKGTLSVYEISSQKKVWEVQTPSSFERTPIIAHEQVYTTYTHMIRAFSFSRGEKRWETRAPEPFSGLPVPYKNSLIILSKKGTIFECNARNGKLTQHMSLPIHPAGDIFRVDDILLIGASSGKLVAYNLKKKRLLWEIDTFSQVYGSPIALDGWIYVIGIDGTLRAYHTSK